MGGKRGTSMISWNIAGIVNAKRAEKYLKEFDIVILQETWVEKNRENEWIGKKMKQWEWAAKAATRENKKGRAKGGVLVGIKKEFKFEEVVEWKYGLIVKGLEHSRGGKVNIVAGYNNEKMKEVTEELREVIEDIVERGEHVILAGDWNARIGRWMINSEGEKVEERNSVDKVTNKEGEKLLEFCEEIGGVIKNGNINGDWEGKETYIGNENSSVLDIVVEIESGGESVIETMKINPRIESDHLPVEIYLKGRKERTGKEKENRGKKEKEYRLVWSEQKELEYGAKMEERGRDIAKGKMSIQERWDRLKENIWEVGREMKLVKIIKGEEGWKENDEDIREQKKKMWKALKQWLSSKSEEDKMELREERKRLKTILKEKKEEKKMEKMRRVEDSKNMSEFWKAVNGFKARRKRKGGKIGKEEWINHFKKLLGGEDEKGGEEKNGGGTSRGEEERGREDEGEDGEEEMDREITLIEIGKALGRMKNGKAAGEDGIVIEFLKYSPMNWKSEIAEILNGIFNGEKMIKGWETARIFPIHKAGDEEDAKNYRGVSLLDAGYKLYASVLGERIKDWVEKNGKLRENQAGFREGRGTREHIFVLNSIINNKLKHKGGKVYVCFIDFKTAFDAVNRSILKKKVRRIGIKGKMGRAIERIYEETENEVITEEGITERFRTKRGVRQGCPLSGPLFVMCLEDLEERWEMKNEGGVVIGKTKIFGLKFADDVAAVADTPEGLRSMLKDLEIYSKENEMEVNESKTKIMIFQKGGKRKKEKWEYKGKELEIVKEYKYLGYWFSNGNSNATHIRKMAAKANKAINTVWGIWKRAGISRLSDRLYLLDAIVKAGCCYGVEIWGWETWEMIERVQSKFVKMAMGLNRNTPDYIWRMEAGRNRLEIGNRERAGRYLMKIEKMDENRWPKICMAEELRGIKNKNPTKWGKHISKALGEVGDGESINLILKKEERQKLKENLERGQRIRRDQEVQGNWSKIDRSKYCRKYKNWKKDIGMEKYWEKKNWKGEIKEQWARIRCGNIGKVEGRGGTDMKCRICSEKEESFEHVWKCEKAKKYMEDEWIDEMDKRGFFEEGEEWEGKITDALRGEIIEEICSYTKKFEETARIIDRERKERENKGKQ